MISPKDYMEIFMLKRLGAITHISSSRRLILRLKNVKVPHLGEKIFDSDIQCIGTVDDIFGPVKSPYLALKVNENNLNKYIGKPIYTKVEDFEKL